LSKPSMERNTLLPPPSTTWRFCSIQRHFSASTGRCSAMSKPLSNLKPIHPASWSWKCSRPFQKKSPSARKKQRPLKAGSEEKEKPFFRSRVYFIKPSSQLLSEPFPLFLYSTEIPPEFSKY